MRVRATAEPPARVEADVLAVPIYREDAELEGDLAELDTASGGAIRRALDWGDFNPIEHAAALVALELPGGHRHGLGVQVVRGPIREVAREG